MTPLGWLGRKTSTQTKSAQFYEDLYCPLMHRLIWDFVVCICLNPCHAEWMKMPRPLLIFSKSSNLIQIVDINSYTECKQCRSRSVGVIRSQVIWIYTICKIRVYLGSAGQGLSYPSLDAAQKLGAFKKVVATFPHFHQPILCCSLYSQVYKNKSRLHYLLYFSRMFWISPFKQRKKV